MWESKLSVAGIKHSAWIGLNSALRKISEAFEVNWLQKLYWFTSWK